ncbi:MAG TPA: hypothetical protein VFY13_10420, partial [Luteolibacter sp.]|nr:hypothetical protein [Luteolibacter sp.]
PAPAPAPAPAPRPVEERAAAEPKPIAAPAKAISPAVAAAMAAALAEETDAQATAASAAPAPKAPAEPAPAPTPALARQEPQAALFRNERPFAEAEEPTMFEIVEPAKSSTPATAPEQDVFGDSQAEEDRAEEAPLSKIPSISTPLPERRPVGASPWSPKTPAEAPLKLKPLASAPAPQAPVEPTPEPLEETEEQEVEIPRLKLGIKAGPADQNELSLDNTPRGRFEGENPNVFEGEDLDLPPFLRKKK